MLINQLTYEDKQDIMIAHELKTLDELNIVAVYKDLEALGRANATAAFAGDYANYGWGLLYSGPYFELADGRVIEYCFD